MNGERYREPVVVGAIFDPARSIRPAWFVWGGRKIRIVRTCHAWREREGAATLYHFSVTDGADTYHLVLNGEDQAWHLEEVQLPT